MMGALLMTAFIYESHSYREICRRFCLNKTTDPDILMFQKRCQEAKIPRKWLNAALWDIEPVTPLGMGNPAMAQAEAQQLMTWRGAYPPEAQQEILHESTLVVTGDARKAARWAPLGKGKGVTDAARDAMAMFGTLMQGVPVPPKEGLSPIEQIEVLLPLMSGVIVRIDKRDRTGTPDEVAGLATVSQYIQQLIQQLATDEQQKERVRQYSDDLNGLNNDLKGLAQRGAEKAQQQNGAQANGEAQAAMAKVQAQIQADQAMAQMELRTKQAEFKQEMAQDAERFAREQRQDDAAAFADIQRERVMTQAEVDRIERTSKAKPSGEE